MFFSVQNQQTEVRFYSTVAQASVAELPVPVEHTLTITGLNNQSLIVLNEGFSLFL